MANKHGSSLMKSFLGGIIVLAVLLSGASARTGAAPGGTNQEPSPRALQIEDTITSGTPFRWEDADKVQNGMSVAEVIAILGEPYSRKESGEDSILIWSYTSGDSSNAVAYRFVKGHVISNHRIRR
jgi:outer membrane protein assembly factor BamE (lipoprotein component of BamABCDE complex)